MDSHIWEKLKYNESEIHWRNGKKAIVMFSGGLDSAVALWWAVDHYEDVQLLTVDYNQPHCIEIAYAMKIAKLTGVPHRIIKLDIPLDFWGIKHYLTRGQAGLMTAIAALDIGHDGADIVHGILRTDDGYGDCNRNHLDSLADILSHPNDTSQIGIATPLRAVKDKQAVAVWGFIYGVPTKWTWSCRNPKDNHPCKKCAQCREREKIQKGLEETYGVSLKTMEQWQNVLGSPFHPRFQEYPQEIYVLVQAFIEMGGLKHCTPGWKYTGPDGEDRIASIVKNPNAIDLQNSDCGKICNQVQVHGDLDNGRRWELCICEDGSVALTDYLPKTSIVELALRKKLVSEIVI